MAKKAWKQATTANVGVGEKLRAASDARRNNTDLAEYAHVVLGLIFLKCRATGEA